MDVIYPEKFIQLLQEDDIQIEGFRAHGNEQDGYDTSISVSGEFESAGNVVRFFNEYVKDDVDVDQNPPVYGSSEIAELEVSGGDSSAMYGTGDLAGEWGVRVDQLMKDRVAPTQDPMQESYEHLSTMTLAAISMAEESAEDHHRYSFYRDLVTGEELVVEDEGEVEPIRIQVEEEPEFKKEELEPREESDSREIEGVEIPYDEDLIEEMGVPADEMSAEEIESAVHEQILSGTVPEAKETIERLESPNYEALKNAEEQGKNRVTLTRYLEQERMEETDGNSSFVNESDLEDTLEESDENKETESE